MNGCDQNEAKRHSGLKRPHIQSQSYSPPILNDFEQNYAENLALVDNIL